MRFCVLFSLKGGNGSPSQKILNNVIGNVRIDYCSQKKAQTVIADDVSRPFNLSIWPLFIVRIICVTNDRYLILFVFHHMIIDGASFRILCSELSEQYNANLNGCSSTLTPIKYQCLDFSFWQSDMLAGPLYQRQSEYWKRNLSGFQELNLALSKPRNKNYNYKGARFSFKFGRDLSSKLIIACQKSFVTPYQY